VTPKGFQLLTAGRNDTPMRPSPVPDLAQVVSPTPIEFQLQVAVPAEELEPGQTVHDLRRLAWRVESILGLATEMLSCLEPLGWRMLSVRFDGDVAIILTKHAMASVVLQDLKALPRVAQASIGRAVHLCVTAGEHVFELVMDEAGFRPLNPADSSL
jgi:hypothetical protein